MGAPKWIWPTWLAVVAGSFAVLEGHAIMTGEDTLRHSLSVRDSGVLPCI